MNPLPFYNNSFVFGSITMTFRAYFLHDPDDATTLEVTCITADPSGDLLDSQTYADLLIPRIEGTLRLLQSSSSLQRGFRFSVEFRMSPRRGLFVDHRMINGNETVRNVPVEKLTRVEYGDEDRFGEKECAICIEDFEGSKGEDLARMPCSHTFHSGCLEKWLVIKLSCPLCRHQIGNN